MAADDDQVWRLLGAPTLPWRGADLATELGRKPFALLAAILISGGSLRRRELAEMLWPGPDHQAARHNLRQALMSIKKALGPEADTIIEADSDTIAFLGGPTVDLLQLAEAEAEGGIPAERLLALCRGPLMDRFPPVTVAFDDQLQSWREYFAMRAVALLSAVRARGAAAAAAEARLAELSPLLPHRVEDPAPLPHIPAAAPVRHAAWRFRYLLVLLVGLGVGTAAILSVYAYSPEVRAMMRTLLIGRAAEVPSIAIRPFEALNGSQVEQNLAGGVTIGVTYGLYVVTAQDLHVVTGPAGDARFEGLGGQEYAAELGVRYLITGTVEQDGGNVRVFVRCLDSETGHDVWQDRFTSPVTEAFELQDEITLRILQGLEIDISSAERNRIQYLEDTQNLQAWLYAVNGVSNLIKLAPANLDEALQSYRAALRIDPDYISARRGVAWHALLQVRFGTAPDPDASIVEARNHLNVILRHRPDDGMSRALEGLMLLLENAWPSAVDSGERASKLLPGSADVWAVLAHSYTFVGRLDDAMEAIDRAMAISPGHPKFYDWIKARALRLSGRTDEAIELLDQTVDPGEDTVVRLVELAAAYAAADRIDEARAVAREILAKYPDYSASNWVLHPAMQDPAAQSLEFELLSKAGL